MKCIQFTIDGYDFLQVDDKTFLGKKTGTDASWRVVKAVDIEFKRDHEPRVISGPVFVGEENT